MTVFLRSAKGALVNLRVIARVDLRAEFSSSKYTGRHEAVVFGNSDSNSFSAGMFEDEVTASAFALYLAQSVVGVEREGGGIVDVAEVRAQFEAENLARRSLGGV